MLFYGHLYFHLRGTYMCGQYLSTRLINSCYIFHVNKIDKILLQLDNLNGDHFRF